MALEFLGYEAKQTEPSCVETLMTPQAIRAVWRKLEGALASVNEALVAIQFAKDGEEVRLKDTHTRPDVFLSLS